MNNKLIIGEDESWADFYSRITLNFKEYGFNDIGECMLELANVNLGDNNRKFLYGLRAMNEAYEDGSYEKFLTEPRGVEIKPPERFAVEKRNFAPRIFVNNNNLRLAVLSGDKHFLYQDENAIDILEQVCLEYSLYIDEFIEGGDGINNNSLSKFIDTETITYNLYEEMKAFENHMFKMKEILPNVKFTIVEDNHYHLRRKRFLAENPAMKNMIKDVKFPFDYKSKHGVPYFPFNQKRIGVIHGLVTNDNFTKGHSSLFKEDIINFHNHTSQHYTCKNGSKALNKQAQKMWGMPSMCKQMDYMNGRPSRSNTGFGMLWYDIKNDLYDLQYIFVENGKAIYNGKLYESRLPKEDI